MRALIRELELLIGILPSDVYSIFLPLTAYCASQDGPGMKECSLHEYDQGQTPDTRVARSKEGKTIAEETVRKRLLSQAAINMLCGPILRTDLHCHPNKELLTNICASG